MATLEMTVRVVPLKALRAHPEQVAIYGAVGGDHDHDYGDLYESVRASGIRVPLIASEGTPGLPDGTVISGHRRLHAATELALDGIPVIFQRFASATHARLALLDCNRSREKDEWVRTQETRALWDIEAELAAIDKARGLKRGTARPRSDTSIGTARPKGDGDTRSRVAARTGESPVTSELRKKLADKAAEQNPERPEESPTAKALKAGKAVKTVAREQGVLAAKPKREPPKQAPLSELSGVQIVVPAHQDAEATSATAETPAEVARPFAMLPAAARAGSTPSVAATQNAGAPLADGSERSGSDPPTVAHGPGVGTVGAVGSVPCPDVDAAVALLLAHVVTDAAAVRAALDRVAERLPSAEHAVLTSACLARESR